MSKSENEKVARATPSVPPSAPSKVEVDPEVVVEPESEAAALLRSFSSQEAARAGAAEADDDSKYQYYIRCHRGHKEPAAFLTKNPGSGVVRNDGWFSTYKKVGEPYQVDVYCQHCGDFNADGEYFGELVQVPLNYVQARSRREIAFIVPPRYLWRYAKDPKVRAAEGNHRAMRMANELMNSGLPTTVRSQEVSRG